MNQIILNPKDEEIFACEECVMPAVARDTDNSLAMLNCVRCPFCQETVSAILTKTKIICPKCKAAATL